MLEPVGGFDRAIRVTVAETDAELVGAVLAERLGPFSEEMLPRTTGDGPPVSLLTFYPEVSGLTWVSADELRAMLLPGLMDATTLVVEEIEIGREWEHGWMDHFHPIVIDQVRIRPPWEAAAEHGRIDVVINPGMGFGTGLHPTTRGTLGLLQSGSGDERGPLVDVGTGSGVLSIAAAKLGWGPVVAFDNDPVALQAAVENVEVNGVGSMVRLINADVAGADLSWFAGATVLANMTLEPVSILLEKLSQGCGAAEDEAGVGADTQRPLADEPPCFDGPIRLVVSGILAGAQELQLLERARRSGYAPGRFVYEGEWVSLELFPAGRER
jgi:ribosomal protein L11 methylase PrmA